MKQFPVLILLSVVTMACGSGEKDKAETSESGNRIPVRAVVAKGDTINQSILSTGTLMANESVEIRSEVSARVTKINFKEGEAVQKGRLLIEMDRSELSAELNQTQIQLELAQKDEDRKRQLLDIKSISQENYDISLSQKQQLQAQLDLLNAQIEKTRIYAPFSGTIGLRNVSLGSYVSPGDIITSLVQQNPMKLEFSVPEKYSDKINEGQKVSFSLSEREGNYEATVYANAPMINAASRSLLIRAMVPNPKELLIPGSFADVEINLEKLENAILVPTQVLRPRLEGQDVFIARGGTAKKVAVETGIRSKNNIQITKGINIGDTVITTGLLILQDGSPVRISSLETLEVDN